MVIGWSGSVTCSPCSPPWGNDGGKRDPVEAACIIALVSRAFDDYEKDVTRYRAVKRELFLA